MLFFTVMFAETELVYSSYARLDQPLQDEQELLGPALVPPAKPGDAWSYYVEDKFFRLHVVLC